METAKPRKLGRGLSALLGEPVAITLPSGSHEGTKARSHEGGAAVESSGGVAVAPTPVVVTKANPSVAPVQSREVAPSVRASRLPAASGAKAADVPPHGQPALSPKAATSVQEGETGEDPAMRVVMVGVEEVVAGRYQPRREFAEAELAELAESIKAAGLVQPILVRPISVDFWTRPAEEWAGRTPEVPAAGASRARVRYELVAGERRWRATKLAGIAAIPAVVRALSDEQAAEWGLIENIQRTDLNIMEKARAVKSLCARFGLTHGRVAEKLGIDRSSAANLARLAEIEPSIALSLERGELSAGHAKALLALERPMDRVNFAIVAAGKGWSVRKLGDEIAGFLRPRDAKTGPSHGAPTSGIAHGKTPPAMAELERQLSEHLGTSVKIRAKPEAKRGSVVIKFYDLDHFDGLMGKMGFRME